MHSRTANAAAITAGRRVRRSSVMTDPAAAGKPGKTSWKRSTSNQRTAAALRFQDLLTFRDWLARHHPGRSPRGLDNAAAPVQPARVAPGAHHGGHAYEHARYQPP